MNSFIRTLLVSVTLLAGAALAQGSAQPANYAGGAVKAGLLFDVCSVLGDCGGASFGVSAHAGAHDLLAPGLGGRASFGVAFARNLMHFQLAADALYEPAVGGSVAPYLGGGLRVGMVSRNSSWSHVVMHSSITFGVGAVGGVRFAVADRASAFLEAGVDLISTSLLVPSVAVGVEFGF